MLQTMMAQVRSFNRVVTQRIGALDEKFLARGRPLGAARVLWEIDRPGRDVRTLRDALGLDSGYLSRLLRSLEAEGLVRVEAKESDRRVRVARLTSAGAAERAVLDERSDAAAAALLAPLDQRQQDRLVAAMAEVERLLVATMVTLSPLDPAHPHARHCVREYVAELDDRFDGGFDPGASISATDDELRAPRGLFVAAMLRGQPVGCGAVKVRDGAPAEIKRMWVARSARGLGLGRRLLRELEGYAAARGAAAVRLETNRALSEAIRLYRSAGYAEVAAFNEEPYAHHWFEKRIG